MMIKILLVDDEKLIVKGVKFSLEQDGMTVVTSHDGEDGLNIAKTQEFDLIILDIMLPKLDGLEICQAIREFSNTPIIMLTAKSEDMDKIMGLEYGADDYITKPFNILELKARIKAILRRGKQKSLPPPDFGDDIFMLREMRVDITNRRVSMEGREVNLTAKEFDLLELFVLSPDRIFTREELLSLVWGYDYPGDVRTVDVHVRRLREKIELIPGEPKYIHTKWGVGYFFK
ncbi:MAG: response regulator transcription factor [Clostridiales bacterium]|nr:response regulator transcription factor [Clostridiales bacterium]